MNEQQERLPSLRSVWDVVMSLVYLAAAVLLLFFWRNDAIPQLNRTVAAGVLFLYAIYRLRKTYLRSRIKRSTKEQE
jgi:DMSO/TMAO reductase YedYZ heme-binding membrane subunit